jgi:hypothetical protein
MRRRSAHDLRERETTDVTQSFNADYEVRFPSSKAEGDRRLKKEARSTDKLSLSQSISLYCGKENSWTRETTDVTQSFSANYEVRFPSSKAEGDRPLKKEARSADKLSLSQFLSLYCGKENSWTEAVQSMTN